MKLEIMTNYDNRPTFVGVLNNKACPIPIYINNTAYIKLDKHNPPMNVKSLLLTYLE